MCTGSLREGTHTPRQQNNTLVKFHGYFDMTAIAAAPGGMFASGLRLSTDVYLNQSELVGYDSNGDFSDTRVVWREALWSGEDWGDLHFPPPDHTEVQVG